MSKIREYARGQMCEIRLPGCDRTGNSTVACHLNGVGLAMKHPDSEVAFGCHSCHDHVDFRKKPPPGLSRQDVILAHHEACVRTRRVLINAGLIILK